LREDGCGLKTFAKKNGATKMGCKGKEAKQVNEIVET